MFGCCSGTLRKRTRHHPEDGKSEPICNVKCVSCQDMSNTDDDNCTKIDFGAGPSIFSFELIAELHTDLRRTESLSWLNNSEFHPESERRTG